MTVALSVRAKLPAMRGAGVKVAEPPPWPADRFKLEAFAVGSLVPVNIGDTTVRRYSYPSMYIAEEGTPIALRL